MEIKQDFLSFRVLSIDWNVSSQEQLKYLQGVYKFGMVEPYFNINRFNGINKFEILLRTTSDLLSLYV